MRDLYSNQLADNISGFINNTGNLPDYNKFSDYIERIRLLIKYIHTIPDYVCYSLFAADMRDVKDKFIKKANELLNSLLKCLENIVIETYEGVIERYRTMYNLINKKLIICEEVVEMEKLKSEMYVDHNVIQKEYDDNNKIINYLLNIDHVFSENILAIIDDVNRKQLKFRKDSDE